MRWIGLYLALPILLLVMVMTRQDFIHNYDKSVFQVRLEVAEQFYLKGETPAEAFRKADDFLLYLKKEDIAQVEERFK